ELDGDEERAREPLPREVLAVRVDLALLRRALELGHELRVALERLLDLGLDARHRRLRDVRLDLRFRRHRGELEVELLLRRRLRGGGEAAQDRERDEEGPEPER